MLNIFKDAHVYATAVSISNSQLLPEIFDYFKPINLIFVEKAAPLRISLSGSPHCLLVKLYQLITNHFLDEYHWNSEKYGDIHPSSWEPRREVGLLRAEGHMECGGQIRSHTNMYGGLLSLIIPPKSSNFRS